MALGVRNSQQPPATMGGRRPPAPAPAQQQLATAAPAARQPTPAETEEANQRTRAEPVYAKWDAASGRYLYTRMGPEDELAWREMQMQVGGPGTPQAPAAPVDPTRTAAPAAQSPAATLQAAMQRAQAAQTAPTTGPAVSSQTRAVVGGAPRTDLFQRFTELPTTESGSSTPDSWQPVAQDYSRYDAEAGRLRELQSTFLQQLERLSGSDPFGNQAALQKATDRAVAQAAGTAAGARGGAAAMAGAQRQAVGVQAQTAARGAQDIVEQRRRDEQAAVGLGLQAISGASQIGQQLTANEIAMGDQAIRAAEVNLRGYLGGQELGQRERESLRQFAIEASQIDMQRYQTDMQYRAQVDQNLTQRYIAGTQLEAAYAKISAEEGIGAADWLMGTVGLASGIAGAFSISSDERAKTNRTKPSMRALREFVEHGAGEFYEYTEPTKPGRRPGRNFGPMAQHLQRSEIGRTLVAPDRDGTLRVDAARLALADHSALTHLAKRLTRLERKASRRGSR